MDMSTERARYVTNAPRIIHETIDNETVAIDTHTGIYFSMTGSGYLFMQMLDRGAHVEDIASQLAAAYNLDIDALRPVVDDFVGLLLAESLIVPTSAAAGDDAAVPLQLDGALFAPPALEKFTDMNDLLLMDPIHEVGDAGWPHRAGQP